jgi:hypothetical protein
MCARPSSPPPGRAPTRTCRALPEYEAPFWFTGGTIDQVVVDVSGERYVDHEAQVRAWFSID